METKETRRYITVKEFLEAIEGRLSRNAVYAAIAARTLPSVRVGRRILLPEDALDRMLAEQATAHLGDQGP